MKQDWLEGFVYALLSNRGNSSLKFPRNGQIDAKRGRKRRKFPGLFMIGPPTNEIGYLDAKAYVPDSSVCADEHRQWKQKLAYENNFQPKIVDTLF